MRLNFREIKKRKYQFIWKESGGFGGNVLLIDPVFSRIFFPDEEKVLIYEKPWLECYISEKGKSRAEKRGGRLYLNRKKVKQFLRQAPKTATHSKAFFERIETLDLGKKDNRQLFRFFDKFLKNFVLVAKSFNITEPRRAESCEKKLRDFLLKQLKDQRKANRYFSILLTPDIPKTILEQRKLTPLKSKKSLKIKQTQIEKELNLPRQIIELAASLREIGLLRLSLGFVWRYGLAIYVKKILPEIAKRMDFSLGQAGTLLYSELKDSLLAKKKPSLRAINQRKEKYLAFQQRNGKFCFLVGRGAQKCINFIKSSTKIKPSKEIQGIIANPGKRCGKVKIILTIGDVARQIKAMKKGQILVTEMTRPHFILAVKKASAIVTDEGGMTSHAAIMSRELDIPCVVGTKIATKTLKDGDLVEVDADKAVVKIIQKVK